MERETVADILVAWSSWLIVPGLVAWLIYHIMNSSLVLWSIFSLLIVLLIIFRVSVKQGR